MKSAWTLLLAISLAAGAPSALHAARTAASDRNGSITCAALRERADTLPAARAKALWEGRGSREWAEVVLAEYATDRELARRAVDAGGDPELAAELEAARGEILLVALLEDLAAVPAPEPELVAEVYRNHLDQFSLPERIVTRFLLLRLPPEPDPEQEAAAETRLESLREQLARGASFAELARRWSEAENAAAGGVTPPSPRGSLVEAYERAAWSLQPGEVSAPVRLPDGLALILLERRLPAVERSLSEVRPVIERGIVERRQRRRLEEALAEARRRWPATLDRTRARDPTVPADTVLGRLGDVALTLESLGLTHRPPHLERRLDEALERLWLARLAEARGLALRPEVAARLRAAERRLLVDRATARLVDERLGPATEQALGDLRERHAEELERPERRRFEVLLVGAREGGLRAAQAAASTAAAVWRHGNSPEAHQRHWWGPIDRSQLGRETSATLADAAFALAEGEISPPLRLDLRATGSGRVTPEGYVVLRAAEILSAGDPSLAEAREHLLEIRRREALDSLAPAIRRDVLEELRLEVDHEALAACALPDLLERSDL